MKKWMGFAVLALSLLLGVAPVVSAGQVTDSVERFVDDAQITAAVKAKLASDVRLGTVASIEVNTTKGVVTLSGPVRSLTEKALVEELALSVEGVKQVNNGLQVSP